MIEYVVNGYDCVGNNIFCTICESIEMAKSQRNYIFKTNKQREKLTRKKIVKVEIIERL